MQVPSSSSTTPRRRRIGLTAIASAALAFGAFAGAPGVAVADDNNVEDASEAVYWAVAKLPNATIRGRTIETSCSGRRSPYSCSWWVIKGRLDRRADAATEELPVMTRRGVGNAHRTPSRVLTFGKATARWECSKRKVGRRVITVCGFSVRLG